MRPLNLRPSPHNNSLNLHASLLGADAVNLTRVSHLQELPALFMPKRDPTSESDLHYNSHQPLYSYYNIYRMEMRNNEKKYSAMKMTNKVLDRVNIIKRIQTELL